MTLFVTVLSVDSYVSSTGGFLNLDYFSLFIKKKQFRVDHHNVENNKIDEIYIQRHFQVNFGFTFICRSDEIRKIYKYEEN